MGNNVQDKQFLALELTKISYGNSGEEYSDEIINDSYEYHLRRLTNTLDEIETIDAIKNECDRLRKENEKLKTNSQDVLKPLINDIATLVNGCKGDMEPYVYEAILSNCRRYEK